MSNDTILQQEQQLSISIRPLAQADVAAADRIFRLAFGTFIGLPNPSAFAGDADYVKTRWRANPSAAYAAHHEGELLGSNFATNWGSVGFFGPLTVRPDLWDRGVAKQLMEPVMQRFATWGTRHAGLFTFPHSQKHIGLYQRFGFWPRFLTPIVSKPVSQTRRASVEWSRLSAAPQGDGESAIAACREVTNAIYDGLDLSLEIRAVADQRLGDTVLVYRGSQLSAFAVCHCGAGTEAGTGTCYVKFGAVRPIAAAAETFAALLIACEELARDLGASRLTAGVNTARHEAYTQMLEHGFRADMLGVAMQRPNEPGYNRPGVYVLDDWR